MKQTESNNIKIYNVTDGKPISKEMIDYFDIDEFCLNGNYNFVGFFNRNGKILFSSPKHFIYKDENDIKLILKCLLKCSKKSNFGFKELIDCNIPYVSYLEIVDYYYHNGLFKQEIKSTKEDYYGNINWNKTVMKSHKIINNNNLIFLPLIVNKKIKVNTFIGECMQYVINDGYEQFGKFINIGERINEIEYNYNFKDKKAIIKQLQSIEDAYFKDNEIKLIRSLISYFLWDGNISSGSYFVTRKFDDIWEIIVNSYLNKNYFGYDYTNQKIIFRENCNLTHFVYQHFEFVENKSNKDHQYWVEYDHYLCSENGPKIINFDSKYYNVVGGLNYKQVSYFYFMMNTIQGIKRKSEDIICGLILPTEKEYYSKTHLNRLDIDGVYIQEHYLNLRKIIEDYVK